MTKERWISLGERVAPLLIAVVGGIWVVYVYTQNQAEVIAKQSAELLAQTRTKLVELQKPFIDQQFQTYNEFTTIIGELMTKAVGSPEWNDAQARYRILHFSKVALVEDEEVHDAKIRFAAVLKQYSSFPDKNTYINDFEVSDSGLVASIKDRRAKEWEGDNTRLHGELDKAAVVLTTALRRGIQKSWTGFLSK